MSYYQEEEIRRIVTKAVMENFCADRKAERNSSGSVPVEISARHVHLSKTDLEILFGKGYELGVRKELSQPGEFASNERVKLITPGGQIENVSVLGPCRNATQVELSATDARQLKLTVPVALSGNLSEASDILILGPAGCVAAKKSTIIAKAHIHMTSEDAERFCVQNGDHVRVRLMTERPVTLEDVVIRVKEMGKAKLAMHIDFDEANAAGCTSKTVGCLLGKS